MEEYSYTSTHPLGHTGPVTGSLYLVKKNLAWYHKWAYVFMYSTKFSCPILMKPDFFSTEFLHVLKMSHFTKIHPVANVLFRAGGRTDRQTDAILRTQLKILRSAPQSVFVCFLYGSQNKTAIISLYNINWLVCITEKERVYCAVRTESVNEHVAFRPDRVKAGLPSSTDGSESLAPNLFSRHYSMRCVGGNAADGNELTGTLSFWGVIMTGDT